MDANGMSPLTLEYKKTRVLTGRRAGYWTYLDFLIHVLGARSRN